MSRLNTAMPDFLEGIPDIGPCKPMSSLLRRGGTRRAYIKAYGPIPSKLEIDHLCGNGWCIEPYHLEAVTHQENLRRSKQQFCRFGHPIDNYPRRCGECIRQWHRKKYVESGTRSLG
jgi:hypothetical protein